MFSVPLTFNKLDMRDYLQRAYGVSVLGIRSAVYQMPLTRDRVMGRSGLGPWRRPPSKKKMIVKLVEPFVWPDAPTDFTPYVVLVCFQRARTRLSLAWRAEH